LGPASSPQETSRSNTMSTIRVGRRHIFYRALDLPTSCACTALSGAQPSVFPHAEHSSRRDPDFNQCHLEGSEMMRTPLLSPLSATFVNLRPWSSRPTCRLLLRHLTTTILAPQYPRTLV
jgi:hypothetical protein